MPAKNFASKGVVIRFAGEAEGLDQVALGQTVLLKVVGHPSG